MRLDQRAFLACFCLLVAAVIGNFFYRALAAPDVQFLAPSVRGNWIVPPDPLPGYTRATFTNRFELADAAGPCPVEIRAMRIAEVTVNGQVLAKANAANWKDAVHYDLGPALRKGANEIRIAVTNPESPPALLVEGPENIRTSEHWVVDQAPENAKEREAAIADHGEDFLRPKPNALRTSPDYALWRAALAAYLFFVAYALVPARWKPWRRDKHDEPAGRAPAGRWDLAFGAVLLGVIAAIHFHNASRYPTEGGFDSKQHAEYIQFVAERWEVPDASQGWEMSQPPLYYALGAALYNALGATPAALRTVQLFTALTALALLLPAWWMLAVLHPGNPRARILGFAVAAMVPMTFYIAPQVTNEAMAALVISSTMALAAYSSARARTLWRDAVFLGIACGLSLLSKYTGAFVTASVLALAGFRLLTGAARADRGSGRGAFRVRFVHLAWALVVAAIALSMSGWLYAHNIRKFGTPFMGAWDVRSGFRIVQPPGYRTAAFYSRFGAVFWQEPPFSRMTSFWDGMYGSMWSDSHNVFVSRDAPVLQMLSSIGLWLALLPTVAIATGFFAAIRQLIREDWDHPYFVLVLTTLLTVASTLMFTLEHPWYSTLKSHWALSLVPCAGVFAALGFEILCRNLGRLRYLAYANVAALGGLMLYVFWYRGP